MPFQKSALNVANYVKKKWNVSPCLYYREREVDALSASKGGRWGGQSPMALQQFRALHLHPSPRQRRQHTRERREQQKGMQRPTRTLPQPRGRQDVTLQSPAPRAKRHLSVPKRHPTCFACGGQLQPFARCPVRRRTRTWPLTPHMHWRPWPSGLLLCC